MIFVILMYLAIAFGFIFAKIALAYGQPFFTVAFRTLTAGIGFLLYQAISDPKQLLPKKKDIPLFLVTSLVYVYLVFIPEFWALEKLAASKVTLIYTLTPFIVALLAYFLINAKFTLKKILGLLVGLAGMTIVFLTEDASGQAREFLYISTREAALLISVVSYGYGWFLIKKLKRRGYTLATINGITFVLGGTASYITSYFYEGAFPVNNLPKFLLHATILTILANGVFYMMYGWLLRRYSFTFLSFAGFLSPTFGFVFCWSILGETITFYHIASLIIIFIGLYIFYKEETKAESKANQIVEETEPPI